MHRTKFTLRNLQRPARDLLLFLDSLTHSVYNNVVGYIGLPQHARALLFFEYIPTIGFPRSTRGLRSTALMGFAMKSPSGAFAWVYKIGYTRFVRSGA